MNKELLRMDYIDTYNRSRKVLDAARLNLFEGEVIGITGVNNAGKTALASGIAGMSPISSGYIYISEEEITIHSIEEGRKAGVYYFSQSSSLIADFTVWENFLLGPGHGQVIIKTEESEIQCREMLELLGIQVNLHDRISTLTGKEKLLVEMARAVYYEAKIMIMDDVLSTLSATALDEFEQLFGMLCSLHIGIILIDNGIRYLKRYCRRLFIMREGRTAAVLNAKEMDDNLIIALMLGTRPADDDSAYIPTSSTNKETLLEMNNICYQSTLINLSFQMYKHETTGILNVGKHSGDAINELLQGRGTPDTGIISYCGVPLVLKSIEQSVRHGITSFAEKDAVIPNLTLEENIMLPALKYNSRFAGHLHKSELKYTASELMTRYIVNYKGICISELDIEQDRILRWKISFCRMLSTNPQLVILSNPTASIDITAKELLYTDIRSLGDLNITPLIISSDIKELFALCDRIIVINHGKAEAEIPNTPHGREQLLYLYSQYLKLI